MTTKTRQPRPTGPATLLNKLMKDLGHKPSGPTTLVARRHNAATHRLEAALSYASRPHRSGDPVTDALRDSLLRRSCRGRAKYGVTLARTDLTLAQWLTHLEEELLDAAQYTRRLRFGLPPDFLASRYSPPAWAPVGTPKKKPAKIIRIPKRVRHGRRK